MYATRRASLTSNPFEGRSAPPEPLTINRQADLDDSAYEANWNEPAEHNDLAAENEELKRRIAALEAVLHANEPDSGVGEPEVDDDLDPSYLPHNIPPPPSPVTRTRVPALPTPRPMPSTMTGRPLTARELPKTSPSKVVESGSMTSRTGSPLRVKGLVSPFRSRRQPDEQANQPNGKGVSTAPVAAPTPAAAAERAVRKTPSLTVTRIAGVVKNSVTPALLRSSSSTRVSPRPDAPSFPTPAVSGDHTAPYPSSAPSPRNVLAKARAQSPGPASSRDRPRSTTMPATPSSPATPSPGGSRLHIPSNTLVDFDEEEAHKNYAPSSPSRPAAQKAPAVVPALRSKTPEPSRTTNAPASGPSTPRTPSTPRSRGTTPLRTPGPAETTTPRTPRAIASRDRLNARTPDASHAPVFPPNPKRADSASRVRNPIPAAAAATAQAAKAAPVPVPKTIKLRQIKETKESRRPSLTAPTKDELKSIRKLDQVAHRERKEDLNKWKNEQGLAKSKPPTIKETNGSTAGPEPAKGLKRTVTPGSGSGGPAVPAAALNSSSPQSPHPSPNRPLPRVGAYDNVAMPHPLTAEDEAVEIPTLTKSSHKEVKRRDSNSSNSSSDLSADLDANKALQSRAVVRQSPAPPPIALQPASTRAPVERFRSLCLADLEDLGMLGRGCFGKVKLVRHRGNNKMYALKILNKRHQIEQQQVQHAINENNILQLMDHPLIVRHHGSFQDEQNLYILMERVVGTEFYDLLQEVRFFDESQTQFFAAQIVLILEHLHTIHKVVYRDLKPENILLDSEGYLKLTDFGFAKVEPNKTFTFCGTPCYIAPEIIYQTGYTRAVDWWALGVMIYEMLKGEPPLDNDDLLQLYDDILNTEPEFDETFTYEARDIIMKLLAKDPEQRLGISGRGTVDVKQHPFFHGIDWHALATKETLSPFGGIAYLQTGLDPYFEDAAEDMPGEPLTREEQQRFKDF